MSKALHRVSKRIDRHATDCQRQHAQMKSEILNAFLRAVMPYFTEEETYQIRRVMAKDLARRKHKEGS